MLEEKKCLIYTLTSGHHFQLQRWASLDARLRPITLPLHGHQQYSGVCHGLVQSPQISDCPVSRSGLYPPANTHCAPTGLKKKTTMKSYRFFSFEKFLFNLSIKNLYNIITLCTCTCISSYTCNYSSNLPLYPTGELDRFTLVTGLKSGSHNLTVPSLPPVL